MRFPDTPFMKRTLDLIEKRSLGVKKIPYIFTSQNERRFYPYETGSYVPQVYTDIGAETILSNVLGPFRAPFAQNPLQIEQALHDLFAFDHLTTRTLMLQSYPSSVVEWCETKEDSTGAYDRALTETVLDSVAFNWPSYEEATAAKINTARVDPSIEWYTLE